MTQGERVKTIRKALGLTQAEFSAKLGIKRNSLCAVETDARNASTLLINAIVDKYNANPDYLIAGNESAPVFRPKEATVEERLVRILTGDNDFVKGIFLSLANLTDEQWAQVYDFVRNLQKHMKTPGT